MESPAFIVIVKKMRDAQKRAERAKPYTAERLNALNVAKEYEKVVDKKLEEQFKAVDEAARQMQKDLF